MYLGMAVWIEIGVKCRFGCHLLQVLRTREWVTSPKEGRQCDKRAPRKSRGSTNIPESWRSLRRRSAWRRRGRRQTGPRQRASPWKSGHGRAVVHDDGAAEGVQETHEPVL